jgi:TPR repeat protein
MSLNDCLFGNYCIYKGKGMRKLITFIGIALFLATGPVFADETAEEHYATAEEHDANGDYEAAVTSHLLAAELGHVESQYVLGISYYRGEGVEIDLEQSAYWYEQAANQEHADAQNALGTMYEKGEGVPANQFTADYWFNKAAENSQSETE